MSDIELLSRDIEAYLASREQEEMVRFLTAGSVDDGKSTLIGRLLYDTQLIYEDQLAAVRRDSERKGATNGEIDLSLLMDGLKAEREQGITIDVAYRYFSTSKRKFIIADCPGHEQYTRNMATGASTCDLAIILIDARNGVLRQTKRHSFIVTLLGIRHVAVAVNKMDMVGYSQEVFERIKREYTEFAARLEINDIRFIPLSALKGDNVVEPSTRMPWYKGETLLHYLETVHIASDRNLIDLRLPVQYVNRPHHGFRGFCGTVAAGLLRTGDELMVLPSGQRSRVSSIVTYEGEIQEAFAPMAVTVTLKDEIDVSRGDMLVHPNNLPRLERTFEAMVVWMAEEPLVPGRQYIIKQTTNLVVGQVSTIRYSLDVNTLQRAPAPALALNEVGRCTVTVNRPVAFDPYRKNRMTGSFIFIDRMTNRTVGAGMIVDRETSLKLLQEYWDVDANESASRARFSHVSDQERNARFGQRPVTILLTGLSGSGKTTIAYALERRLFDEGRAVCVLDGRQMRQTISRDLGFSAGERSENLRRAADVARMMNDAGIICICAFLAPSGEVRDKARMTIGADRFMEIHLSAPIEVCTAREQEDMNRRAYSLEIADIPGITSPYDVPSRADLVLNTESQSVDECVARLIELLRERGVFE